MRPANGKKPLVTESNPFPFRSEADRRLLLDRYEEILALWPTPVTRHHVGQDVGTHVLEWGNPEGAPLVLVHGSSSNSMTWMGDAVRYGADHHAFALDVPGDCGDSTPERPPLTGDAYAQWLLDTLDAIPALAGKPVRLLGLSLGGWISLQFATRYPERVAKLGLLCPAGIGPQKLSLLPRLLLRSMQGEKGIRRFLREISGDSAEMTEEAIDFSLLIYRVFHPIKDAIPLLTDEELNQLSMPVRLLAGGRDVMLDSRKSVDRLKRCVPHADCVFLPEAPHGLINRSSDMVPFFTGPS